MIKNGYSKGLGVIFLIVVLAAIVSGVYYWQVSSQPINFDFLNHKPPVVTHLEYKNDQYQFAVKYLNSYQLDKSGTQENYFKTGGTVQSDISIPSRLFPRTNFGLAHATFSVKEKSSAADCATYLTGANSTKKMTKTVVLPAGKFYTDEFKGAAAGTAYDTKLYRIFNNGICYEAALTVGIANIGNYEPGAVSEVNEADVWNDLSAILVNFKFTDEAVDAANSDVQADGTLQGHVDIGPNCPVEQVSNPCPPSQDAYDAVQIIVYTADRNMIVKKVSVNLSGDYHVVLPVGVYYATYSSSYSFYQAPVKKVTITANHATTQDFSIDTGIR